MDISPIYIEIKGSLPWGQVSFVTITIQITCSIGKISKPKDVKEVIYPIGATDWEYKLPLFTWEPHLCPPTFNY
jgi:hypothetical protein